MNLKLKLLIAAFALTSTCMHAGEVAAKNSDSLAISGDLRIRYENREEDDGITTDGRNRLRTRFRLATSFKIEGGWDIHAGLATGGSSGTSTNDTWNEGSDWETGDIRLDYAYAERAFETGTKVIVGQQESPWKTAELLWDGDLRPTGFTAVQGFGPGFVTAGYYNMKYTGGSNLGDLYGVQAGVSSSGDVSFTAALGYFVANEEYARQTFGTPDGTPLKYDFEVIDLYADVTAKVAGAKVTAYVEAGKNQGVHNSETLLGGAPLGYTSGDNDTFYTFGAKTKVKGIGIGAQYFHVEGDSIFDALSNSDLGDAGIGDTDVEGYTLSVSAPIGKNATIGASYWVLESIERKNQDAEMFRLELKYKF